MEEHDEFVEENVHSTPKDRAQEAKEMAKEAVEESKKAFKILLKDPMGGQSKAMEGLDTKKMIIVGSAFSTSLAISMFLYFRPMVSVYAQMTESSSFLAYLKLFLSCLVLPISLTMGHLLFGHFISQMKDFGKCVFIAGVNCLPVGVGLLASWILKGVSWQIAMATGFFGLCISVLLTNASLLDVHKINTQKAVWLTPSILLVSLLIAYTISRLFGF